jgi:hypothetical protein
LQDQRLLFRAPDVHHRLHLLDAVLPAQSRPVIAAERASVRAVGKCVGSVIGQIITPGPCRRIVDKRGLRQLCARL